MGGLKNTTGTWGLRWHAACAALEAMPVFQQFLKEVPNDEIAVFNATQGLEICAESAQTPQPTIPATGESTATP